MRGGIKKKFASLASRDFFLLLESMFCSECMATGERERKKEIKPASIFRQNEASKNKSEAARVKR
jgi:hypothetical protein